MFQVEADAGQVNAVNGAMRSMLTTWPARHRAFFEACRRGPGVTPARLHVPADAAGPVRCNFSEATLMRAFFR